MSSQFTPMFGGSQLDYESISDVHIAKKTEMLTVMEVEGV